MITQNTTAHIRCSAGLLAGLAALVLSTAAQADKNRWPQVLDVKEGKIVVYQPQPESLEGNVLKSRAAVSITTEKNDEPVFGAVWFESQVEIRKDDREIEIMSTRVTDARIADAKPEGEENFIRILQEEIKDTRFTCDYDQILASLQDAELQRSTAEGLKNAPPRVIFEFEPAILVVVDGKPVLRPIPDTKLERVVNTPSYIVKHSDQFWLNGGKFWFSTKDVTGEWNKGSAPYSVEDQFEKDVKASGADVTDDTDVKDKRVPKIIAAVEPTELIVVDGESQFQPIVGDELLYVTNTESDVFMEVTSQKYYIVLSGRWYRSLSTDGPWQYVRSDSLPASFARIPPSSDKGEVLPYVAGTQEAKDAMLDAQVPQTAGIVRSAATLTVAYDGEPKFEPIPGTSITLAQNTDKTVMKIDGKYYCCDNAIWFIAEGPKGPWAVCDAVPEEVQKIPPESAAYNTKYVYVYESTPEVVYVGYTPAYVGCYPYYGSVVYGTGWYYHPWVSPYYYYPRPVTWGFHAHYNPYYGWSYGMSWSSGWAHVSVGFGGYGGYHGGWWGPPGYHHYPGHHGGGYHGGGMQNRPDNIYNRPSTKPAVADRATMDRNRPGSSRDRPTASTREAQPSRGTANNVYADKDGNVMRRENDGSWSQRDNQGNWKSADGRPQTKEAATRPGGGGTTPSARPETRPGSGGTTPSTRPASPQTRPAQPNTQQLDRDYQNRQHGNQRASNYQGQSRSRPSSRPAGRAGGGGRRR